MKIFTPNTIISSTDVNANFDDLLKGKHENPYFFSARRTGSANTLPDATLTDVIYNTIIADPNNNYDNTTGIYTIPITGYYQVQFTNIILSGADVITLAYSYLYTDGVNAKNLQVYDRDSTNYMRVLTQSATGILHFTAGQTIQMKAFADTTTSVDSSVYYDPSSQFSARLISV